MPTYTVTVANLSLTTEQENSIAEAITESHHVNTGAPGFFAQVLFNAVAGEKFFRGKDLPNAASVRARANPSGTQCGRKEQSHNEYCKKGRSDCRTKIGGRLGLSAGHNPIPDG